MTSTELEHIVGLASLCVFGGIAAGFIAAVVVWVAIGGDK